MPPKKRIQYKPVSLRELLTKMKDETELMIDLAYSAVLFRNKEITEEVMKLEEDVDSLTYLVGMNTMLAARD
ncbi:MAG: PhoU domain-containing protein, partial [Promethearchaeota archaeon]